MPEWTEELAPGTRIEDRYVVEARLSAGAMGAVYRARADDGSEVAIKRLIDPGQASRFEIEARLLARLSHPRVVSVVEHLPGEAGQFLVMPLIDGEDLNQALEQRGDPGLPAEEVLEHARQAGEALRYVHEQGVVHRDVKPHNLIRGESGIVLVDFGIARETTGTQSGTRAIGTPLYMAPEVFVGEEVSARSDVYGLAATIWALLAGKPPSYEDPTPLARTVDGVSPQIERTLRAGLQVRPERRLSSVASLAAGLGVPLSGEEGRSLAISVDRPTIPCRLLEEVVRTTAGVFEAAAASIGIVDAATGELVYEAAWGAGAEEVVRMRLPRGEGIGGSVVESGEGVAIPDCRSDPRFAETMARRTGYVPHTMLVAPLIDVGRVIGTLTVLDRRDGGSYGPGDLERAGLFADLAVAAIADRGS